MLRPYNYINAYDNETGLLRTAGGGAEGGRQGYSCGVSQAGAEISPGSESGRQIRGRKIQKAAGSLRRPLRFEKTAGVRPARRLQRQTSRRGAGWSRGSTRTTRREHLF